MSADNGFLDVMEEAYAEEVAQPKDPASLEAVRKYAGEQLQAEDDINDLEEQLKTVKKRLHWLRTSCLPEMMAELKITSIGVNNRVIEVKPMVQGTLSKDPDKRQAALNYVIDLKEGGVIKRALEMDLPKGSAKAETMVLDALKALPESLKLDPKIAATIHPQTYTAMCKRLVESGADIDKDKLGIFVGAITRIKEEK